MDYRRLYFEQCQKIEVLERTLRIRESELVVLRDSAAPPGISTAVADLKRDLAIANERIRYLEATGSVNENARLRQEVDALKRELF